MAVEKQNGDIIEFIKQKDYIMVNNDLGGGSFGKTVVLKDPYIDELFVAKKYEPTYAEIKEQFYKNFLEEIKILYKLNHKNIVRIFSYYAYENIYCGYILMEFIDGVTIAEYLTEYREIDTILFDEVSPDSIFIQLIDAFSYIEKHNIIHRDIREGNIMIDKSGTVKVIDFGIGKLISCEQLDDSLRSQINRRNSDTLPQEYYEKKYTSLTDMFYLAELFNRLIREARYPDEMNFSYQCILDKMMQKRPEDRYSSFTEIKEAINKRGFINLEISEKDKRTYHAFVDGLYRSLTVYTSEMRFNVSPEVFIDKLEKAVKNNLFEDYIQKNEEVINSIVSCGYRYSNRIQIPCEAVKLFLKWYESSNAEAKELILQNIIAKLSNIPVSISDEEIPF